MDENGIYCAGELRNYTDPRKSDNEKAIFKVRRNDEEIERITQPLYG